MGPGEGGRERLFIFVIPIEGGDGLAARAARARLDQVARPGARRRASSRPA